jgi:PMC2NT (NUC016) domain
MSSPCITTTRFIDKAESLSLGNFSISTLSQTSPPLTKQNLCHHNIGVVATLAMVSADDFKSVQEDVKKSLISVVKTTNRIADEDLGFQRTVNPDVADLLDERSNQLLALSTRLLRSAANACGLKAPQLDDNEDIDLNWRQVVDVIDTVLEKADTALDEYTGLIKRKEPPTESVCLGYLAFNSRVLIFIGPCP